MDCWKALFMQVLHQQKVLIDEQINNTNSLFELAKTTYSLTQTELSRHTSPHRTTRNYTIR
jgi:hypothetical protein